VVPLPAFFKDPTAVRVFFYINKWSYTIKDQVFEPENVRLYYREIPFYLIALATEAFIFARPISAVFFAGIAQ
jgi:hypothetical protein